MYIIVIMATPKNRKSYSSLFHEQDFDLKYPFGGHYTYIYILHIYYIYILRTYYIYTTCIYIYTSYIIICKRKWIDDQLQFDARNTSEIFTMLASVDSRKSWFPGNSMNEFKLKGNFTGTPYISWGKAMGFLETPFNPFREENLGHIHKSHIHNISQLG